jgi:ABC-2 type transport system ATP-binding protein
VIAASQLTRRFDDRLAVDHLTFDVRPGEVFALLGPNGAGKTTTLRMLAGLIKPTSGTVTIDGCSIDRDGWAVRARVGLLTEAPGLWERLTVEMNLLVYARLHGLDEPRVRVRAALGRFDLLDRAADVAAELSRGMKQRLAIARALLHNPKVVLLDEPTSGLDPRTARNVREIISSLRDEGRAVILSSHNLDEVERLADRVAVIEHRLIALDSPAALRQRLFGRRIRIDVGARADELARVAREAGAAGVEFRNGSLFLDATDRAGVAAIVRALVAAGGDIFAVVPDEVRLEDVYLRLIE